MPATRLTNFAVLSLTAYNGGVAFTPASGSQLDQLWVSDGSTAGTRLVKDLGSSNTSKPSYLTVVGGQLLFAADDGIKGRELWRSDGSSAGTVLVSDVNPGSGSGLPPSHKANYRYATEVNGGLFFAGSTASGGTELWKSDGTTAGTVLVKDIYSGSYEGAPNSSYPYELTAYGRQLLFVAADARNGFELWKSDGSTAGTVLVKDIYGGAWGSYPGELTVAGATLYFAASDLKNGRELWKSDGSSQGTVMVANLDPSNYGSDPRELTAVGSSLFFLADSGTGETLWISDGTAAGTRQLGTGGFICADDLTAVGTTLFFVASDSSGDRELWKSDGSTAGTVRVANINPAGSSNPGELTVVGGSVYFAANDGTSGRELWRSDGTAAGTVLVEDINPGAGSSNPTSLQPSAGRLYLNASDANGPGLWQIGLTTSDASGATLSQTGLAASGAAPRLQQVTTSGSSALLSLDQAVSGVGGSLNASHFLVVVGGIAVKVNAASLDASGTLITLSLASAPAATAICDVLYCPPAGAINGTLVARNGGAAMQAQTINSATTATSFRSSSSVAGLAETYTSLELLGTMAINGSGNGRANVVLGNGAANVLNGLGGLDAIDGRDGGDIYLVTSASDHGTGTTQAAEFRDTGSSSSIDEVRFAATSITGGARLTLFAAETGLERAVIGTGTAASASTSGTTPLELDASAAPNALTLVGNNGSNRLIGTAFADTLLSNSGNDLVTGGGGRDSFVFNLAGGQGNRDTITDFQRGTDVLSFSRAVYRNLGTGSTISADQLLLFSGGTPVQTANTRFLFNTSTAMLSYDADGSGRTAALEVAQLTGLTGLSVSDFTLIA